MQGHEACAFGDQGEGVAPPEVLDRWQKAGDPRLWKMIVSPEFGERIDLNRLTYLSHFGVFPEGKCLKSGEIESKVFTTGKAERESL